MHSTCLLHLTISELIFLTTSAKNYKLWCMWLCRGFYSLISCIFLSFRSRYSPQNNWSCCSTVLSAYGINALPYIAKLRPCWLSRRVEMECCTLWGNEWIRGSNDTKCCQSASPSPYMNKTLVLWYSVETYSYILSNIIMTHLRVQRHYLTWLWALSLITFWWRVAHRSLSIS
jgi:hypothetical protein